MTEVYETDVIQGPGPIIDEMRMAIVYDFEEFALKHGIPETLDPLPYRKAGSVFATGEEAEPVMTSAKNDPRLRTVVCRHWLRDLCMKGKACEFLHQYDLSKMPLCRHGDRCVAVDCPFRHISEADRLECVFYSQGFCIHGPFCRYKHLRRDRADLPAVADFTLGLSQMQAGGVQQRRPAPKPNEFYKVSLCKHFLQGDCPFGEGCHFAHGEAELKRFPRQGQGQSGQAPGGGVCLPVSAGGGEELGDNMFQTADGSSSSFSHTHHSTGEGGTTDALGLLYYHGGDAGGGRLPPIVEPSSFTPLLVEVRHHSDLVTAIRQCEWYLPANLASVVHEGLQRQHLVLLFFTVSQSRHLQGVATVKDFPEALEHPVGGNRDDSNNNNNDDDSKNNDYDEQYTHRLSNLEWERTTELPWTIAKEAVPDLLSSQVKPLLTPDEGEALLKALWNAPLVDHAPSSLDSLALSQQPRWPVTPGPGYLFGCNSRHMDECLGRGLLGLPTHMASSLQTLRSGSTVFLYNATESLVFGVFETLGKPKQNLEPTAFLLGSGSGTSAYPFQVRFRVALECPPLQASEYDPVLEHRGGPRVGPLTHAETAALANRLAVQCGALEYMTEYVHGRSEGKPVQAPPIALPPRRIEADSTNPSVAVNGTATPGTAPITSGVPVPVTSTGGMTMPMALMGTAALPVTSTATTTTITIPGIKVE